MSKKTKKDYSLDEIDEIKILTEDLLSIIEKLSTRVDLLEAEVRDYESIIIKNIKNKLEEDY